MKALFEEMERAFDKNERQISELLKQTKANGPPVGGFLLTGYTKTGRFFFLVTGVWEWEVI